MLEHTSVAACTGEGVGADAEQEPQGTDGRGGEDVTLVWAWPRGHPQRCT
jgi:hypothetical protein